MINYTLLLEVLITSWYVKEIVITKDHSLFTMLMLLLIYQCIKTFYYIASDKKLSKYILLLLSTLIILLGAYIFWPLAYFLSLNIAQFIQSLKKQWLYLSFFSLLYALWLPYVYIESFLLINLFALLLIFTITKISKRFNRLSSENACLRKEKEKLKTACLDTKDYASQLKLSSRLQERNVIAQKLHDELGHTLSGSTMQLEATLLVMDKNKEKASQMLSTVIKNLRDGTESIRKILKTMKPETAIMNMQTIRTLAMETQDKSAISIELIYDSDIADIDYIKWDIITKTIKEALTNMMKYSKATKCSIKFERLNKYYKISVQDNGMGCYTIKKGMGLQGMDERITKIGGQLILDGTDGFSIIMLLPILIQ